MFAVAAAGAAGRYYYVNDVQTNQQSSSTQIPNTEGDANSEERLARELDELVNGPDASAASVASAPVPSATAATASSDGLAPPASQQSSSSLLSSSSSSSFASISLAWMATVPARARDLTLDAAAWASDSIRGAVANFLDDGENGNSGSTSSDRRPNSEKAVSAVERRRLEKLKSAEQVFFLCCFSLFIKAQQKHIQFYL
jgi:hypothetical protein